MIEEPRFCTTLDMPLLVPLAAKASSKARIRSTSPQSRILVSQPSISVPFLAAIWKAELSNMLRLGVSCSNSTLRTAMLVAASCTTASDTTSGSTQPQNPCAYTQLHVSPVLKVTHTSHLTIVVFANCPMRVNQGIRLIGKPGKLPHQWARLVLQTSSKNSYSLQSRSTNKLGYGL